jgi:hypothetical protein
MKSINVTNVPRLALLKPEHTLYRLGDQYFKIGERIVHASDIGSAPLGAKGTIIGMENKYLEILFDEPFLSGSLGGRYSTLLLINRCADKRGMFLQREFVLNISSRPRPPIEAQSKLVNSKSNSSIGLLDFDGKINLRAMVILLRIVDLITILLLVHRVSGRMVLLLGLDLIPH